MERSGGLQGELAFFVQLSPALEHRLQTRFTRFERRHLLTYGVGRIFIGLWVSKFLA